MRINNGSSIAASPFRQRSIEPEKNKIAEIKLGQIIPVDQGMSNKEIFALGTIKSDDK
jgi:hypothetical protein